MSLHRSEFEHSEAAEFTEMIDALIVGYTGIKVLQLHFG